jgi:sodium-dependent dicarboxylate transporter 2/3/5
MMIASMMPLFHHIGEKSPLAKTLLTGIPLAATVGGMGTVIGSPANAIAAGALESTKGKIDFLEWMYIGFPLAVSLTSLGWYMLVRSHLKMAEPVSLEFLRQANEEKPDRELRRQRRITIATLIVTLLLWMTGSLHNLSVAAVSAIPIVVLSMTGIIDGDDVNNLSWETLLLVAGGLSLGIALQDTGVLAHFAGKITGMKLHPLVLLSALGFITMIVTNIMSSTAAATILIPLALTMLPGAKPEAALIVGLCASTGLLLPISTPPNAIAYSTGYLQQKDFRRGGILIGLAGPILILLWVLLLT